MNASADNAVIAGVVILSAVMDRPKHASDARAIPAQDPSFRSG
jgi:hypothetical protein